MKVTDTYDLTQATDFQSFQVKASQVINDLVTAVNGKLELGGTNVQSQIVSVTFNSASASVSVSHNLNKTGVSFIPVRKSKACDVFYAGSESSGSISLQCTQATTVSLLLF